MDKKLASGKTTTNPRLLKELYRTYYRESWRFIRIILTILSIPCFFLGLYFYTYGFGRLYTIISVWLGLIFIIYPRNAFRRPYKQVKNDVSTVFFTFYENEMKEKTDGKAQKFRYDKMHKIIETPQYFYFFHSKNDVSVLDKKEINDGTAEDIAVLLKNHAAKYKKV